MEKNDSIKIEETFPPNYQQFVDRFPQVKDTPDVLFMYNRTLHNPHKIKLLDHVIIHETVHSYQQNGKPEEWYEYYFNNTEFRMCQEVEAYGMQYAYILEKVKHKNVREGLLFQLVGKLTDPIYEFNLNHMQAELKIKRVAEEKSK